MFLRPRKFGKTLFTSVLENYYDVLKENRFEELFKETYIGKNPTPNKNKYHILKFNFSGIDTTTEESTINGFKNEVASSINYFVNKYNVNFFVNTEDEAENILENLFKSFNLQKSNGKIYVIIDEYDHFANELLGFQPEQFNGLVSKNGKIRKWYEILKKGTETVVERIFITGVAPITLDSLTSGFNISKDITRDARFNEMMGFTKEELINLMDSQQILKEKQEEILPIMKENYDGYKFSVESEKQIYNSNMCLYFLADYIGLGKIPQRLVDVNIASDYNKIGKMLNLYQGKKKIELIEKTVSDDSVVMELTEKFNPAIAFKEKEIVSMLFYLGYLTIKGEEFGRPVLKVPNKVMKNIYSDFFLEIAEEMIGERIEEDYYAIMIEFKYLKKDEKSKLEEKQKEARQQIEEYSSFEEIKFLPKLRKYTVVAVNDELYVEEI